MPENQITPALVSLISALAMGAIVVGVTGNAATAPAAPMKASAQIINTKGQAIGTASLMEMPDGVKIRLDATGLPPGQLAFHIHQSGTCDTSSAFKTAGDHFNPEGKQHGSHAAGGSHAGDMLNLTVAKDGTLHTEIINTAVTLNSGTNTLIDPDGSALVIHSKADDYRSQPSGNAGDRIACAVIKPSV